MNEFRNSALAGLAIGLVGFAGLTGVAFYNGVKSTAKVIAPVVMRSQVVISDEQVPVRDHKSNKLDRRQAEQPYFGRVLPFDISKVI